MLGIPQWARFKKTVPTTEDAGFSLIPLWARKAVKPADAAGVTARADAAEALVGIDFRPMILQSSLTHDPVLETAAIIVSLVAGMLVAAGFYWFGDLKFSGSVLMFLMASAVINGNRRFYLRFLSSRIKQFSLNERALKELDASGPEGGRLEVLLLTALTEKDAVVLFSKGLDPLLAEEEKDIAIELLLKGVREGEAATGLIDSISYLEDVFKDRKIVKNPERSPELPAAGLTFTE